MTSTSSPNHFALVVCAKGTSSELLLKSLAANKAWALNVFNYENWTTLTGHDQYDLLWIKKDGSHVYATELAKKEEITNRIIACAAKARHAG